jgi:hypothetical protein
VSTEKQAEHGVSLEAQSEKIRAMAVVQGAELADIIVDAGESAKSLDRPGMERLLALVDARKVDTVIIAKLDRLTRHVKDLAELLERFERRNVSLVSVADSLDTRSAAGWWIPSDGARTGNHQTRPRNGCRDHRKRVLCRAAPAFLFHRPRSHPCERCDDLEPSRWTVVAGGFCCVHRRPHGDR